MKDKILKRLKAPSLYYSISGVALFLVILISYYTRFVARLDESGNLSFRRVMLASSIVLFTIGLFLGVFFWQKQHKIKAEKLFLVIAIPLGIIYLAIAPLLTGNDDPAHFIRIYEISEGHVVSEIRGGKVGAEMPKSFATLLSINGKYSDNSIMRAVRPSDEKIFFEDMHTNTALYSPLSYAPQVMGLSLGKLVRAAPFWLGTLARVFNLIFYILICYLGFKLLPRFTTFFLILLTSPAILSNATSLSADAFTAALVFLFIALITHIIHNKKIVSNRIFIALIILSIFIAGCKIVYLPVIFLTLLISEKQFGGKKLKIIKCLVCIACGLIVGILWLKAANTILNTAYPLANDAMSFTIHNPVAFLFASIKSLLGSAFGLAGGMFSSGPMYHSRAVMDEAIVLGFVIVAIIAIFSEQVKIQFSKWQRLALIWCAIIIVGLTCAALYTQWTPQHCIEGESIIGCELLIGMQGRYFIPVATVAVLALEAPRGRFNKNKILLPYALLQSCSIITIMTAFIG